MFGRWVTQAIGRGIVSLNSDLPEAMRNGWKTLVDMPVKHLDMQAAMDTHLSQPIGTGALDGQHGMSFCHLVRRGRRRRHLIRHRLHRHVGSRLRHDGPGNRSQRKARDHHDRKLPAYGNVAFHGLNVSQNCGEEKSSAI